MDLIKLTDRMPNPDEHDRVLIYTEGVDFNGVQFFDVKAETLNECFYADPEEQPEVCQHATHWMPRPQPTKTAMTCETLADAIRSTRDINELKRLVGPSEDEKRASINRLSQLDALAPRCAFGEAGHVD